ncbi:MAG TPA: hypothetical protein VK774_03010 [Solirubrobacteraceae bacterium]|jgi:hypothetical protein|nr:hypothetical protein [Solirubrobacteraceae bacterium]
MLGLVIVFAVGGFAIGSYATYRYAPPLAQARGSVAVGLIVCALVGAAIGLACMYVYLAIHGLVYDSALTSAIGEGNSQSASASPDANVFVNAVFDIATQSGVLLALALGLYLLSAPAREGEVS